VDVSWLSGDSIRQLNTLNGEHFDGWLWILMDELDYLGDDLHLFIQTSFEANMNLDCERFVRADLNVEEDWT
jgi:hypothetical protein